MAGIDRHTGKRISNLDSATQAVIFILSTRMGDVPLLREFGGGVVELLGRAVTPALFAAWKQLIATAIDLWEPRFKVRRVLVTGSAEKLRMGQAGLLIEADFRPRGHLGDFTVERVVTFGLGFNGGVTLQ
ncbi:GPW/gp25 family protein [Rhizobium sp. FKY42]|uniref:GPW/gp25 family protein n=1 Tax=Rhizobium sp. FKY42 TaxID=2562310 RepID=UPI0010C0B4C2|nr:GPW/gp25 family protein [Rhizobium sp. FKY42]